MEIIIKAKPKEITDLVSSCTKSAIQEDIKIVINPQVVWKATCDIYSKIGLNTEKSI